VYLAIGLSWFALSARKKIAVRSEN
jgi:hypothetical protein